MNSARKSRKKVEITVSIVFRTKNSELKNEM